MIPFSERQVIRSLDWVNFYNHREVGTKTECLLSTVS